jgi:hypothetical protein
LATLIGALITFRQRPDVSTSAVMVDVSTPLPARRSELLIRPLAEPGRYVVKHPQTGDYFQIGEEEHFLLNQLDGRRNAEDVRTVYAERFGRPLPQEDVDEFVQLATEQQLAALKRCTQLFSRNPCAPSSRLGNPSRNEAVSPCKSKGNPARCPTSARWRSC